MKDLQAWAPFSVGRSGVELESMNMTISVVSDPLGRLTFGE